MTEDSHEQVGIELAESLLLSFRFRANNAEFILVVADYGAFPPSRNRVSRTFAKLMFRGVTSFAREAGQGGMRLPFVSSYDTARSSSFLVQDACFGRRGELQHVDLWFDSMLGGVSFRFASMDTSTRNGTALKSGDPYFYSDTNTGAPFEFEHPFRNQLD